MSGTCRWNCSLPAVPEYFLALLTGLPNSSTSASALHHRVVRRREKEKKRYDTWQDPVAPVAWVSDGWCPQPRKICRPPPSIFRVPALPCPEPPFHFRHFQRRPGLLAAVCTNGRLSLPPLPALRPGREERHTSQVVSAPVRILQVRFPSIIGSCPSRSRGALARVPRRTSKCPDCLVQGHPVAALPQRLTE
jgi:hypothetical protein